MTIMNNALSGAIASQLALSATSQNIANLQTKGYTRQAALLTAVGPNGGKSAGNGVEASTLLRFSDGYKSQQMWRAASETGQHAQTQPYLTQLERVMSDDSASLSSALDQFFASLNAVAGDNATSTPLRQQVLTAAELLSQRFNSLNNVYTAQRQSLSQQRSAIVDSANAAVARIAALNVRIAQSNAVGASTSALIDARDLAIDELSGMVALEVADQPGGVRDVSLRTGHALVIGGTAATLGVTGGSGGQDFTLDFAGGSFTLDTPRLGGQLGGLSLYERDILLPMQEGVADIARQLADKVNTQLQAGFAMDGSAGQPLFVFAPGATQLLQVATPFESADLAFSSDGTPGDTGNLQLLVAIHGQDISVTGLGTVLMSDADTQLVGQLGVISQQNQAALGTAQTMRAHAIEDWQSTSGVNQDEEAINLVEYQNMYQANMKVMSVANALFDATLAMMG
jgi:flagellar hook-associated protein 1 FlgK